MKRGTFSSLVIQEFSFVKEISFTFMTPCINADGESVKFLRRNWGVSVDFEVRDSSVTVWICKLERGKFIDNEIFINSISDIKNFCLDDFVFIKNPSRIVKSMYEYPESAGYYKGVDGFSAYIKLHAECFRDFGLEVMNNLQAQREIKDVILFRSRGH
jgi:hypothetical protein